MMNKHLIFLLPLFIALSSCDSSTDIISSSTVGLEQIYNSGYIDGYNDAKQDYSGNKYESGYNDGFADGYNKGLEDGKDQEINASIRPGNNLNIHTDKPIHIPSSPENILQSFHCHGYLHKQSDVCPHNYGGDVHWQYLRQRQT